MLSPEDRKEDQLVFLRYQVKQLEKEVKELRQKMNALAHAVALISDKKKTPLWVKEYYRNWEEEQKKWFGL